MLINNILINNLRNHGQSYLEFNPEINLIYGLNGSGKTTILEAISIIAISKSFLPGHDKDLISYQNNFYSLLANSSSDYKSNYFCKVIYKEGERKKISNTDKENARPKDLVGRIPIVILSPDYKSITFGSPDDRRQFIDRTISQASKSYLDDLFKLKRILKQRNSILNRIKKEDINLDTILNPWTLELIEVSANIIYKRNRFINEIKSNFINYYRIISNESELVDLVYEPHKIKAKLDDLEIIKGSLISLSKEYQKLEKIRGTSCFGPQKDELIIRISNGIARENASQGQHKSILIALKLSEFHFLKERCNENPIILLDDIFSELDEKRSEMVLRIIKENGVQSFITSTDKNKFENYKGKISIFKLDKGIVTS